MLFRKRHIATDQKILLFRQLSYLLAPDYPILKAIEFLRDDLDDKKVDRILISMLQDLERGLSLSESSEKYPSLFTASESRLIEIGEERNNLAKIFENLAEDNESKDFVAKLWKRLFRSALFYIVPAALLLFLYLVFVLPAYEQMFTGFGSGLPILTQIIIDASKRWSLLIYFIIFIGLIAYLKQRIKYLKSVLDFTVLRVPIIGYLYKQLAVDNIARALATMMTNRAAVNETVQVAAMALDNAYLRRIILKHRDLSELENRVSATLRRCKFIPTRLVRLITTAEEKDYDPAILEFAKTYYSDNAFAAIVNAQEKLQIVLRIIFGIVIGIVVMALYLPIFKMAGSIG